MRTDTAWDRQRAAIRAEITATALDLFLRQGFEATSIDQILDRVGVSRRSFFRYFGTKEDVVLGDLIARGEAIAAALGRRPIEEDPWTALRTAFGDAAETSAVDSTRTLAVGRMLFGTPSLRARHLEKRLRWQELLVPLIAARLPTSPDRELQANAIVAAALTCLDAASRAWLDSDGRDDLGDLYDRAVAAVRMPPGNAETTAEPH
ncbi:MULTISPECIES: TetR/AcrR family transcriptional regulator [unclassified Microbacterium]|uniref:TetR/AcrR family transcriptional regulator n=1 Tax=unclassified Microbacterium TaxID=2609290 RepID=UPI003016D85E